MTREQRKKNILKHGATSAGKTHYLKYLNGKKLTRNQAILAKCFECSGYYADGRSACEITDCPIWPWAPYSKQANVGPE